MWLEIDGDTIIGTHSDKCESSAMWVEYDGCLLYTSPSPRDDNRSRMPSSA